MSSKTQDPIYTLRIRGDITLHRTFRSALILAHSIILDLKESSKVRPHLPSDPAIYNTELNKLEDLKKNPLYEFVQSGRLWNYSYDPYFISIANIHDFK